jgi:hypothetical protein
MKSGFALVAIWCAVLSNVAGPGTARAQHIDVLVQQQNGMLITGNANFDGSTWTTGRRVFSGEFDGDFAVNSPGYNALAAGSPSLPAGAQALPGNSALSWDFLPMTIAPRVANLFYWNGLESDGLPGITPSDVQFGGLPGSSYSLSLFDQSGGSFAVNGSANIVPGGIIDDTAADGSLHRHRFYFLQDGDGNSLTLPADGIYLFAMRFRMTSLESSKPIFMVFGTPGSSVAALDDAAVPWVEQQLNLPGDYNRNGVVDAADYALWRDTNGQMGIGLAADGDGNQHVEQADYVFWRQRFGQASQLIVNIGFGSGATAGLPNSAAVPEPYGGQLFFLATVGMGGICRLRSLQYRIRILNKARL